MSAQFEEALSLLHEANTAFVKLVWMGHLKRPEHRDLAARIARFTAGYTEPESSEDEGNTFDQGLRRAGR